MKGKSTCIGDQKHNMGVHFINDHSMIHLLNIPLNDHCLNVPLNNRWLNVPLNDHWLNVPLNNCVERDKNEHPTIRSCNVPLNC